MAKIYTGEVHKQDLLYVESDPADDEPTLDLVDNPFKKCCFTLEVFADTSDSDTYKNDKTLFAYRFPVSVSSVTLKLQKKESGAWVDKATLNGGTYGTFNAFGYAERNNKKLINYYLSWRAVLSAFDTGRYRVKRTFSGVDRFSEAYCLYNWNANMADNSVRLRWINNSIIGDEEDSTKTKDYSGLRLEQMLRVPRAMFGFKESTYENESVRYDSGFEKDYINRQTPTWKLEVHAVDYLTHNLITDVVLQADELFISDYNSMNPIKGIVDRPVMIDGNYTPNYTGLAPRYSVVIPLRDRYSTKEKKFC